MNDLTVSNQRRKREFSENVRKIAIYDRLHKDIGRAMCLSLAEGKCDG